jgi:hypothetical protein
MILKLAYACEVKASQDLDQGLITFEPMNEEESTSGEYHYD